MPLTTTLNSPQKIYLGWKKALCQPIHKGRLRSWITVAQKEPSNLR